jgi:hypothetical protein
MENMEIDFVLPAIWIGSLLNRLLLEAVESRKTEFLVMFKETHLAEDAMSDIAF